ncbi:MAG: hypothetical protein U0836_26315 [Pirellulales bacterium]
MGTVVFMPNRDLTRRFEEGRGLVGGGGMRRGWVLRGILAGGEDYFFRPDPAQPVCRSLKTSRRVLAELPPAGRQAYELHYAAGAARQLAHGGPRATSRPWKRSPNWWTPAGAGVAGLGAAAGRAGAARGGGRPGPVVASPVAPDRW